jgi:hypothetical protein
MDKTSWPVDHRQLQKITQTKGKAKANKEETTPDYPRLEHGSLSALTLSSSSGRLEWAAVAGTPKGNEFNINPASARPV